MKYLAIIVVIVLALLGFTYGAQAATILFPTGGGTGKGTFTAGLLGASGTNPFFTQATTTVSCSGSTTCTSFTAIGGSPITISSSGGSGSGNVATSSAETATYVPFWDSTAGTPALLSGGTSNFTWDGIKLFASQASTTQLSVSGNTYLATSLTGFLKGTSGLVSAVSSLVPGDISLTKGNFLVGNDAGVAQATSSIFIGSTGRVGIGTTNPLAKLDVASGAIFLSNSYYAGALPAVSVTPLTGEIRGGENAASSYGFLRLSAGSTVGEQSAIDIVGYNSLATDAQLIRLITSGNERMRVTQSGNVGIGTTTPIVRLSIANNSADGLSITNTSQTANNKIFAIQNTGSTLRIAPLNDAGSATADGLQIDRSGNVGIGTTSPESKLTVTGAVSASGLITSYGTGESFRAGNGGIGPVSLRAVNTGNDVYFGSEGSTAGGFFTGSLAYSSVIYSNTAIQQIIGGTSRMIINTAGNVGVGTTSPAALLSVGGTGYFATSIGIGVASPTNSLKIVKSGQGYNSEGTPAIRIMDTVTGNTALQMGVDDTLNIGFIQAMQPLTSFSTRALVLQGNGGNVGIGTTTPDANLSVYRGTTGTALSLTGSAAGSTDDLRIDLKLKNVVSATYGRIGLFARNGAAGAESGDFYISTVNNGTLAEKFRITNAGYVGIGTTNPLSKLHIVGANTAVDSFGQLAVMTSDTFAANTGAEIALGGGYSASATTTFAGIAGRKENSTSGDFAGYLQLFTSTNGSGNAERMRITSAGNVGIGTTTPATKLDVNGEGRFLDYTIPGSGTGLEIAYDPSIPAGRIIAIDRTASTFKPLRLQASSIILNGGSEGNVGIGTTTPWRTLAVTGTVGFDGLSATGATESALCLSANKEVTFNSGVTTCLVSSARFKENIENLSLPANVVLDLIPRTFNYKNGGKSDIGFIAEEVAAVDPRLATYDKEGKPYSLNEHSILSVTVKAVQAIWYRQDAQEARISELEARLNALEGGQKQIMCVVR